MASATASTIGNIIAVVAVLEILEMKVKVDYFSNSSIIKYLPHGEKHGGEHEAQHEPCLAGADNHDNLERHPVVEAAVLDGDGHDEAPEKHVVGGIEIVDSNLTSGHQTQQWQPHLAMM